MLRYVRYVVCYVISQSVSVIILLHW